MLKTQYFTKNNITTTAKAMYRELDNQFDLHKDDLDIEKSALMILDMQKFFHDKTSHAFIPSANAIIDPINSLAHEFVGYNRPIILSRHINTTEDAKQMDYWWRDIITEDSKFSEIISEIAQIPITDLIIKSQYDAFYNTHLEEILHKSNTEQVIITGIMSHLCCETTARSAFVHGYNVFFPVDGTATYNEQFHNATLINLAHGFANITLIDKLLDYING